MPIALPVTQITGAPPPAGVVIDDAEDTCTVQNTARTDFHGRPLGHTGRMRRIIRFHTGRRDLLDAGGADGDIHVAGGIGRDRVGLIGLGKSAEVDTAARSLYCLGSLYLSDLYTDTRSCTVSFTRFGARTVSCVALAVRIVAGVASKYTWFSAMIAEKFEPVMVTVVTPASAVVGRIQA